MFVCKAITFSMELVKPVTPSTWPSLHQQTELTTHANTIL